MKSIEAFKCTGCGALKDPATEPVLGIQMCGRLFVGGEEEGRLDIGNDPQPFCSWQCLANHCNEVIPFRPVV